MRLAEGPRPWSIWAFCTINLLSGLFELAWGIAESGDALEALREDFPDTDWTFDHMIILNSALFSIVLIPIVAIWFFASKVARAIVTAFACLTAVGIVASFWAYPFVASEDLLETVYTVAVLGTFGWLFVPSANQWFEKVRQIDPATFD